MARTKKPKSSIVTMETNAQASKDVAESLAKMFDNYTVEKFGSLNPPPAYLTPSGIRPLDALLGGGFMSSAPIAFSSTPETGKSTVAYQMARQFLDFHESGIVVFADVEGSGSEVENADNVAVFRESRPETFGLDKDPRFRYSRRPFTIKDFFEYLEGLINLKRQTQVDVGAEIKMLIILDSITALSYSRIDSVEDFDKIPGKRAAELSFYLQKFKQNFAYDRIAMIVIDQIKAAMSLKGMYEAADEKSVGLFNNVKTATGVYTFQHNVAQWLYFSKGTEINEAKFPGWDINGWILGVWAEKNKATASQHEISVVFDKRNGIDQFWSEFYFISNYTPSEVKLQRGNVEPFMPLCIKTEGAYSKLEVINVDTGEVLYTSKGFYKKNAKNLYEEDEEFRKWFDIAVDISCKERISKGLLKIDMERFENTGEVIMEEAKFINSGQVGIMGTNIHNTGTVIGSDSNDPPAKKRGRKPKNDGYAISGTDQELEENEIILE